MSEVLSVRLPTIRLLTTLAQLRGAALYLPDAEAEAAVARYRNAERLVRAGKPTGFRAPLADVDGKDLNALVQAAWAC